MEYWRRLVTADGLLGSQQASIRLVGQLAVEGLQRLVPGLLSGRHEIAILKGQFGVQHVQAEGSLKKHSIGHDLRQIYQPPDGFSLLGSIEPVGAPQDEHRFDECNVGYKERAACLQQRHCGCMLLGHVVE